MLGYDNPILSVFTEGYFSNSIYEDNHTLIINMSTNESGGDIGSNSDYDIPASAYKDGVKPSPESYIEELVSNFEHYQPLSVQTRDQITSIPNVNLVKVHDVVTEQLNNISSEADFIKSDIV